MTQTRNLPKGELSVLNIGLDWAEWLETDTITLSEWTADAELTLSQENRILQPQHLAMFLAVF